MMREQGGDPRVRSSHGGGAAPGDTTGGPLKGSRDKRCQPFTMIPLEPWNPGTVERELVGGTFRGKSTWR